MPRIFEGLRAYLFVSRAAIRDVAITLVPQVMTALSAFVTAILIARGLGPEGMGKYALIISFSTVVTGVADLGIGQTAIRFASRAAAAGDKERQLTVLRWAFRFRLFMVSIIALAAFLLAPVVASRVWHSPGLAPLVRLSLLMVLCSVVASVPLVYFQSEKRFAVNAGVSVSQTLLALAGMAVVACGAWWRLDIIIMVNIGAAAIGAVAFSLLVPRGTFFDGAETMGVLRGGWRRFWSVPRSSAPKGEPVEEVGGFACAMVLSSLLVMISMQADVWLMGYFLDKEQVGVYNVATRFTQPLAMVLGAINTALWPRAAAATTNDAVVAMMRTTFRLGFVAALFAAWYALCVPLVIPWLFGGRYEHSVLLGHLLCLRYSISFLICPLGVIGYSLGLMRVYVLNNVFQLLVVVVMNCLLLPRIGPAGSACALLINETLGALVIGFAIRRRLYTGPYSNRRDLRECP